MSKPAEVASPDYLLKDGELKSLRNENIALKAKLEMAKDKFDEISALCLDLQYMLEKLK